MRGKLYVVATPIGNLEDITIRALEVLKSVSAIASEDTRVSSKLLNHYGIRKKLISNFKENESKRVSEIEEILEEGGDVALISDAGTPLISDPGKILVATLKEKNFDVIPIPGASSLTAALSVCGFEDHPFVFYGFVPKKEGEKKAVFEELKLLS
ncbi:MAG: 16S rRNA (cytidine(1402)-2'-O)-methyltransferase, partial [Acidobacteria bacterium]|nr:16S rRNA (cytidine(1402)-2'-O)-methyltransferase [Acidobacteriota bacterium]